MSAPAIEPAEQPISAPLQLLPRAGRQGLLWALPFVLSLLFVVAVAAWLAWSDERDLDDRRRTLISDALSLESLISARIDEERGELQALAASLAEEGTRGPGLAAHAAAGEGLRRLWISLTWLDEHGRIVDHLPPRGPQPLATDGRGPLRTGLDEGGLTAHLMAELPTSSGNDRGRLVARYAPTSLLRQTVPWWLARRYGVRIVDGWDLMVASTADRNPERAQDRAPANALDSHRVSLEPALPDAYLELTVRDAFVPWWRTLPLALIAVFVLLVGAATWMLRRQVIQVSRAEAAWRTEAAWRRAMEDSLTVGLRARDLQGRLVYVNPAFCDQVGFGPEELLGRGPPMPYWPPDAIDESLKRMQRNLSGGAPREGYETRWVRRDGRTIDVMIFEARLVDAAGRHFGWMGSTLDITERRRMEERERHQSEAMAHQARLTTLGEVASALAHQLNQPLTAIAGYNAGVLRSLERAGFGDAMVIDAVQRLGEQASEAGRIVKRIREFLTRRSPQREACDIAVIAGRAASLLRRDLQRLGVALDWAIAPELPLVQADPVLVEQVVINLLRNACDEMADCDLGTRAIRISLGQAGLRFVRLDIDDSGPGLKGRSIEDLCMPFYSTKADGMGMGLAICRSIIEAHIGALDAGRSPLGGARFSFTLPVATATARTELETAS